MDQKDILTKPINIKHKLVKTIMPPLSAFEEEIKLERELEDKIIEMNKYKQIRGEAEAELIANAIPRVPNPVARAARALRASKFAKANNKVFKLYNEINDLMEKGVKPPSDYIHNRPSDPPLQQSAQGGGGSNKKKRRPSNRKKQSKRKSSKRKSSKRKKQSKRKSRQRKTYRKIHRKKNVR